MVEVLVEFDYDAEQEDELTIRVGDTIKNVIMSEGGWWEGELNGKKGMFPDNFVKVKSNEPEKPKEDPKKELLKHQQRSSVKELANKLGVIGPSAPQTAPQKKRDSQIIKKKAKVLFDYEPTENEDELKIEEGQIVEITKQEEDGWWEGSIDGKTGVFPSNFVELIEEADPEQADKTPPADDKPKDSGIKGKKIMGVGLGNIFQGGPIKLRTTQGTQKTIEKEDKMEEAQNPVPVAKREKSTAVEKAIVRYSYEAQNEDELTLNENDIVTVVERELEDVGWWKVNFHGKIGVFPDNFVELLPPEEPRPKKPPPPSSVKVKAPEEKKLTEPVKPDKPVDNSEKLTKKKEPIVAPHNEKSDHAKSDRVLPQEPSLPEKFSKKKENTEAEKHGPPLIHGKKPSIPPPVGKKPVNPPRPSSIHESKLSSHAAKEDLHNKEDKKQNEEPHFDSLEPTSEKLVHLTASRAKGPTKRPPSQVMFHNEEERNGDVKDSHWIKEDKSVKKQPSPPHKETIKEEVSTSKEKAPHLPTRPPEPSIGTTALLSAIEDLKREVREIKAHTVSKAAFEELKSENEKMKHEIETLRTGYSRKLRDLINEVDEEKKIRLSTQVEIDRIKKLVNESHV